VTITGQKQGLLKGTAPSHQPNATGEVFGFSYEVEVVLAAGSATSGAGAGKTGAGQHSAIVFSRHSDGASPNIYLALTTGEILSSVKFEFFRPQAHPC